MNTNFDSCVTSACWRFSPFSRWTHGSHVSPIPGIVTNELRPLLRCSHCCDRGIMRYRAWLTDRPSFETGREGTKNLDRRRLATIVETHTRRERTSPGECRISCGERERRPGMEEDGECSLVVWTHVWQNETEWREWRGDEVLMRLDERRSVWCRVINKCGETMMEWGEILVIESGVKGDCLSLE